MIILKDEVQYGEILRQNFQKHPTCSHNSAPSTIYCRTCVVTTRLISSTRWYNTRPKSCFEHCQLPNLQGWLVFIHQFQCLMYRPMRIGKDETESVAKSSIAVFLDYRRGWCTIACVGWNDNTMAFKCKRGVCRNNKISGNGIHIMSTVIKSEGLERGVLLQRSVYVARNVRLVIYREDKLCTGESMIK